MKHRFIWLSVLCILPCFLTGCHTADERAAMELVRRIVPRYSGNIRFVQTCDSIDVFELSQEGNKLTIKANNANSMATGLNHYLKECCMVTVSWSAYDPVQYPLPMPRLQSPVRVEARTGKRFFLNYCTFGYSMPWWKWEDWERLIDWMALNGVTMPLASTGQEAVWQTIWRRHGLDDDEIRSYFTGPAHLAWHRMNNIDGFDGPLPQGWIDSQAELQKRILKREREFNMRPVLPAFSGHVPPRLKEIYPDAEITRVKRWSGFPEENLCHFLSPCDSLYGVIQKEYLCEQELLFGTDHIYSMDLFNEIAPPSWDPSYLAGMSSSAYSSLASADSSAVWLQMGWMFFYDSRHWTPENMEAYLSAVPSGRLILLDYYMEKTMVWEHTDRFHGHPYILCYLGNFGGNTRLSGDFHQTSERIERTFRDGGENLAGLGCTLEGFGVNQFMYEYVLDRAWHHAQTDSVWTAHLADRRCGFADEASRDAWRTLCDSVYVGISGTGQTPITCARPCPEGHWYWTANHNIKYDNRTLVRVWKLLVGISSDRNTHLFDLVNVGTQALANHLADLRDKFTAAYRRNDIVGARLLSSRIRELINDIDALAACHPQFRLDNWLDAASLMGTAPGESEYYMRNARRIITTWGRECNIRDYGSRQWSGLVDSYYAPRWHAFLDDVLRCMETGDEYDHDAFMEWCREFEEDWVEDGNDIVRRPARNPREISMELIDKYFK